MKHPTFFRRMMPFPACAPLFLSMRSTERIPLMSDVTAKRRVTPAASSASTKASALRVTRFGKTTRGTAASSAEYTSLTESTKVSVVWNNIKAFYTYTCRPKFSLDI